MDTILSNTKRYFKNKKENKIILEKNFKIKHSFEKRFEESKNILESFGKEGAGLNGSLVPAPKIEVINTNGAGDALIGSFLAFKDLFDDKTALFKAVGYASRVCRVNGPRLI